MSANIITIDPAAPALAELALDARDIAFTAIMDRRSDPKAEAILFERALKMIARGDDDAISIATAVLHARVRPGRTISDVLREEP